MGLYIVLWHALQAIWVYVKRRYLEEEYPCELDMDDDEFVDIYPEDTTDDWQQQQGDNSSTAQQSNDNDEVSPNATRIPGDFESRDSGDWEDLDTTHGEDDAGEGLGDNADQPAVVEDETPFIGER